MRGGCPGQDRRNLTSEMYLCPDCGAEVEIFSSETRVRCYQCGETVHKEQVPSCVDWCAAARECLGEERWRMLKGEG